MTLESQVVSLSLAKRLKKLGVKQDSSFIWAAGSLWFRTSLDASREDGARISEKMLESAKDKYAAFTVAELGEYLHTTHLMIDTVSHSVGREPHEWSVCLTNRIEHIPSNAKNSPAGLLHVNRLEHVVIEKSEADARAKMLIYLIEKKHVSV